MSKTTQIPLESAVTSMISAIVGLALSKELDNHIDIYTSNLIGMTVESVMDLITQNAIFTGSVYPSERVILESSVETIVGMVITQVLFVISISRLIPILSRVSRVYAVTLGRIIVESVVFVLWSYPFRRYYMYGRKEKLRQKKAQQTRRKATPTQEFKIESYM